MINLEIGQVLSLKIRYNNTGNASNINHPYLIVGIDHNSNTVEIAQLDSLKGKEYKAAKKTNKTIFCDDPTEAVIDKDSYIQLDNTFKIENCNELLNFRRQSDRLSNEKLKDVLTAYEDYHQRHRIDCNKSVFMDRDELLERNTQIHITASTI